jgi:hypothetical protein
MLGRIGAFTVDFRYAFNSFWNVGRNDLNTIWLHEYINGHPGSRATINTRGRSMNL